MCGRSSADLPRRAFQGVERDVEEGLKWLYLSREKLHSSRYLIFRLEGEVSEGVLAEGQRRARAWHQEDSGARSDFAPL